MGNLEKERDELKAHVSELRDLLQRNRQGLNNLMEFHLLNQKFWPDNKREIEKIDNVLSKNFKQSLADIELKAMKKGYWQGFETSRCMPDEHNILMFWTEYENKIRSEAK